jgi:hypothetical protein
VPTGLADDAASVGPVQEVELLVLRHENQVLRRQLRGRPTPLGGADLAGVLDYAGSGIIACDFFVVGDGAAEAVVCAGVH